MWGSWTILWPHFLVSLGTFIGIVLILIRQRTDGQRTQQLLTDIYGLLKTRSHLTRGE